MVVTPTVLRRQTGEASERGVNFRLFKWLVVSLVVGMVPGLLLFGRLFHSSVSAVFGVEWPLVGGGAGSVFAGSVESLFSVGFSSVSGGGFRGAADASVLAWVS